MMTINVIRIINVNSSENWMGQSETCQILFSCIQFADLCVVFKYDTDNFLICLTWMFCKFSAIYYSAAWSSFLADFGLFFQDPGKYLSLNIGILSGYLYY